MRKNWEITYVVQRETLPEQLRVSESNFLLEISEIANHIRIQRKASNLFNVLLWETQITFKS